LVNPKHCAVAGAGGFVLSVLIALAAGNGGGFMLVRALVCAGVAAGVWAGISAVAAAVLGIAPGSGAEEKPQTGSIVDIDLGDDGEDFFSPPEDGDLTFNQSDLETGKGLVEDDAGFEAEFGPRSLRESSLPARAMPAESAAAEGVEEKGAFTPTPLAAKPLPMTAAKEKQAAVVDNLDPAIAAKTIQTMLAFENNVKG
jgi:hypothetical protein